MKEKQNFAEAKAEKHFLKECLWVFISQLIWIFSNIKMLSASGYHIKQFITLTSLALIAVVLATD